MDTSPPKLNTTAAMRKPSSTPALPGIVVVVIELEEREGVLEISAGDLPGGFDLGRGQELLVKVDGSGVALEVAVGVHDKRQDDRGSGGRDVVGDSPGDILRVIPWPDRGRYRSRTVAGIRTGIWIRGAVLGRRSAQRAQNVSISVVAHVFVTDQIGPM
jgi:hypothetical protein